MNDLEASCSNSSSELCSSQRMVMSAETIKILVVGATAVGKTSLIRSVLNEDLSTEYEPTLENWYSGHLHSAEGVKQKIQFLDTGGYEKFPELVKCYIKMAKICIVVMQYGDVESSLWAQRIVRDIQQIAGSVPILCVSTKCDTEVISAGQLYGCGGSDHIICSSKLNIGMSEVKSFLKRQIFSSHEPKSAKKGLLHSRKLLLQSTAKQLGAKSQPCVGSSALLHRRHSWRTSTLNRSSSHSDITALKIPQTRSPLGSTSRLHKLTSSATTEQISEIYKKYGYKKKAASTSSMSSSFGSLTLGIKTSTSTLVRSVQNTFSKFASS